MGGRAAPVPRPLRRRASQQRQSGRTARSFVVELVGQNVAATTFDRAAERARRPPTWVRRVVSAPVLGLAFAEESSDAPDRVSPPSQQRQRQRQRQPRQNSQRQQKQQLRPAAGPEHGQLSFTPAAQQRPRTAVLPPAQQANRGRSAAAQRRPVLAPAPLRRPSSAAGSVIQSLALGTARPMRATSAAVSRPVAAQQRAKEWAMEYENSQLSQLQPELEPEPEPELEPQANVLDDETMAELLFQEIDADGSGTLDWGEIDALAKQLGKPLSEAELTAAMLEMDEDGNGKQTNLVRAWLATVGIQPLRLSWR